MGRKPRKRLKFPKKRLPLVTECPKCGKVSLRGVLDDYSEDKNLFRCRCPHCSLEDKFPLRKGWQKIDGLARLIDRFYEGRMANVS